MGKEQCPNSKWDVVLASGIWHSTYQVTSNLENASQLVGSQ